MKKFFDATLLLDSPEQLRQQIAHDGYLFLKQILPSSTLIELRKQIIEICVRHDWVEPHPDPLQAFSNHPPVVEGDEDYFPVYNEIQRLEAFHALAHEPCLMKVMQAVIGESAFPHPLSICRLVFPNNTDWRTPSHQDYPNNQGTKDLYASWIPLGDCPQELGSLTILRGSHHLGLLPLTYSLGAGHRKCVLDNRHEQLEWVSGDFASGDLLVFHSLTVHRALPNTTKQMRLSVDYRFQKEHEDITSPCLEPHFRQEPWDKIYQGWQRQDLKYYWRNKKFNLVDWDSHMHDLSESELKESIRMKLHYDRRRRC